VCYLWFGSEDSPELTVDMAQPYLSLSLSTPFPSSFFVVHRHLIRILSGGDSLDSFLDPAKSTL
jgi:hypothetical protein